MQLVQLELRNYLAYQSAVIHFPTSGLSLIAGPNNAGKSALLSAIDALVQIAVEGSRAHSGTTRAELIATYRLSDEERITWITGAGESDRTDGWLSSDALRFVEWDLAQAPDNRFYALEVRASDAKGRLHPVVTKEERDPLGVAFRTTPFTTWLGTHDPADAFEITTRQRGATADSLFAGQFPSIPLLGAWLAEWRVNTYHFGPLRIGTQRSRSINATPRLAPSGENLPEVLHWFGNNRKDTFGQIRDTISRLVPQVGELTTPVEGPQVEVAFDGEAGRRNLKDLGTGVEQLLLTAVAGITQPRPSLMLIEEPETALHSEAQRWLLAYLEEWSLDRQFVITTHSGIFLDRAPQGRAPVWLVERDSGVSTLRLATDAPADVLAALGVRLSDVLSARGLLLVEGRSDRDVILRWFGDTLNKARIIVVESGGGDAVWDVEQLTRWITAANQLSQPCLFIRDRDEMDEQAVRSVAASSKVKVLAKREIENYLLDPAAVRAVVSRLLGGESMAPSESAIAEQLEATAELLRPVVLLKRVAFKLGRFRPIGRRDLTRLAKTPTLERLKEALEKNRAPLDGVDGIWAAEQARLDRQWKGARLALAPGEELLSAVWTGVGLSFDKNRDCISIAELVAPPKELVGSIEAFAEQVRGGAR
jgi:predicted ATPase